MEKEENQNNTPEDENQNLEKKQKKPRRAQQVKINKKHLRKPKKRLKNQLQKKKLLN